MRVRILASAIRIFAVLLAVTVSAIPASAARRPAKAVPMREPSMQVYLVRSAQPGCEPNCPEWISAQGKIEAGTLRKFKAVLGRIGKRDMPVFLHSGGGSVSESMAIARLVRARGLDTVVTQTVFTPCAPTDKVCRKKEPKGVLRGLPHFVSACASSCTFVLAGGKRRFVGPIAKVGVHQIKTLQTYRQVRRTYHIMRMPDGSVTKTLLREETLSRKTVEMKTGKDMYDDMGKFFAEMGIGKEIVPLFQSTPNSDVRWLTADELQLTRLATDKKDGLHIVSEALARTRGSIPMATAPAGQTGAAAVAPKVDAEKCQKFGGAALGCNLGQRP